MPKVTMHRVSKLLTLSTLSMSQAVRTRRVLPCEPLCARLGDGVACVPAAGIFSPHRAKEQSSLCGVESRNPVETQRRGFGGKRTSDRERESCRLRRDEGFVVRSDDGQHRICLVCGEAAALPNAPGGQSPAPKFRAEARTHF